MELLLILFVATDLLLALISIPLMLRRIPPNPLYGFRVRRTLEDPAVWYAVNAYAGGWLFAVGLISALSAALLYRIPGLSVDLYAYLYLGVFLILLAISLYACFRYLRTFRP